MAGLHISRRPGQSIFLYTSDGEIVITVDDFYFFANFDVPTIKLSIVAPRSVVVYRKGKMNNDKGKGR